MGRVLFRFLLGALAGLLAWMLIEPSAPNPNTLEWTVFEMKLMGTLGLLVGGALGFLEGKFKGTRTQMIRGLLVGAILGAAAAGFGRMLGGVFLAVAGFNAEIFMSGAAGPRVLARILALTPLGLMIGLGIGASTFNLRRFTLAGFGGLLGGILAGALFDLLSALLAAGTFFARTSDGFTQEIGQPGRAAMCLLIGGGIGLFIGFLEQVTKTAWVRLQLGRNEGKEWIVDRPQTMIGKLENADIPLYGDPSVAPNHATIVKQNDAFWLFDAGTPAGVSVNGQRVSQVPLQNGDQIQVGSNLLIFSLRAGSAPARAAERLRGTPVQPVVAPVPVPVPVAAPVIPAFRTLVILDGPMAGQRTEIRRSTEIGREANDIRIGHDRNASRVHARISPNPDGTIGIEDLGSTNGTFVNQQRISSTIARAGDVLKVGETQFRIE
jgi:pSer/pThr/pTyr-binding forkhead associated (FHA) protein